MIARVRAHLPWKIAGGLVYAASFPLYLAVQRHGETHATAMPWSAFDLALPVIPMLLAVYLVQLVAVSVPFLFIARRDQWLRAAIGLTAVSAVCMSIHWWAPTRIEPWPHPSGSALAWLNTIDGRGNACPSLHAACAIYSGMLCSGFFTAPRWLPVVVWSWTALMLIACISLRQHTVVDLLAGGIIGGLGGWLTGVHALERRH